MQNILSLSVQQIDALNLDELSDEELDHLLDVLQKRADAEAFKVGIDYNIVDVALVDRLEDKLGLITLAMTMAYKGGVNYADTLGTTAIWDSIIYRELAKNGIVIPPSERKATADFPGGYVKDVQVGLHDWVVSFDVTSLYPMTMVQYNMSTETIIGVKPDVSVETMLAGESQGTDEYALAANGSMFSKEKKGVIPSLIDLFFIRRKTAKNEMLGIKKQYELVDEELKKRGISV